MAPSIHRSLVPKSDGILKRLPKFLWITSALFPPNKLIKVLVKADHWLHLLPVHTQIIGLVIFWLDKEYPDCLRFIRSEPS